MRIPKYRKHSSGQARVTLGGQTYYLGKHGSQASKEEYHRLVGEYIASGGVVVRQDAVGDLSVTEMMLAYLQWAKQNYRTDGTELLKIKRVVNRTREFYSRCTAAEFGFAQFEAVRCSLVDDGVGRKYVNEQMKLLVRIFRWSASRGLVPPSVPQSLALIEPLKRGRTSAPEPKPVNPVEPGVVEETLPQLPEVVADMVRLQSLVGCRPGELCKIMPCMIDRSNDVWEIRLHDHKTAHHGKQRILYVGPEAQKILASYLLRPEDQYCFQPVESERKRLGALHARRTTPISCGNRPGKRQGKRLRKRKSSMGDCYTNNSYRQAIHRACDRAFPEPKGLTEEQVKQWRKNHRWSPNQLRHTFGTNVRRTVGLEEARLLMGHSDASTTTIYAEADRQKAIEAAKRVG